MQKNRPDYPEPEKRAAKKKINELENTIKIYRWICYGSFLVCGIFILCAVLDSEYYPSGYFENLWKNSIGFAKITALAHPPVLLTIIGLLFPIAGGLFYYKTEKLESEKWDLKDKYFYEPGVLETIFDATMDQFGDDIADYLEEKYTDWKAERIKKKNEKPLFEDPEKFR